MALLAAFVLVACIASGIANWGLNQHAVHAASKVAARALSRAQANERQVAVAGCRRGDVKTRAQNRDNFEHYKVETDEVALLSFVVGQAPSSRGSAILTLVLDQIKAAAADETWTPITLCSQAYAHPVTYKAPEPVAFSMRLPPSTAMTKVARVGL